MEVRLLGPLEVTAAGGEVAIPGERLRALVVLLALDAGRVVSVDRLLDALYGEDLPQRAGNALQQAVSKVRKRLADAGEPDLLVTRPPGYVLEIEPEQVDALRVERMVADARAAMASGDPATASRTFAEALALWRGEALADLALGDGVLPLKARWDELHLTAVEDRVDAELALGNHAAQVAELEALVAAEPLRERRWGQLMLALYRSGRQADALRAFRQAHETLVDELGIEPGPDLRVLEGRILAQDPDLDAPAVPAPTPPKRRGNLRQPLGPCLGRDEELARLEALLAEHRLVTVVATGGAGKTRTALELGHRLTTAGEAVWWIDLAPVTDPAGVVDVLRRAVGLSAGNDLDELAVALEDAAALLVLDNCEQVVEALAPVVDELLGRCPELRTLATSREGLGVPGEVLFPLPALGMDAAVELFTSRLPQRAEDDDPSAVRAICDRLDSLPLAIELAAARARHLGLQDLLDRLDHRFDVLSAGPRTAQARQRSLRAVIDWSYELLDDDERAVFARLAVLRDGAPLEAAARIGADGDLGVQACEDVLARLADKSLVIIDASGAETRVRLLQTLADYAADRLAEHRDREGPERRRAAWILDLAGPATLEGAGRWDDIQRLQREGPNTAAAVEWALADDPEVAFDLCAELAWFWFTTLQVRTGWAHIAAALALHAEVDPGQRARVQSLGSLLAAVCGEVDDAAALSGAALTYARASGDPARLASALVIEGAWRGLRGQPQPATAALDEAVALGEEADLSHLLRFIGFHYGIVALVKGDLEEAEQAFLRVTDDLDEDDLLGQVSLQVRLGDVAMRRQRPEEARRHLEAARRLDPDGTIPALYVETMARLAWANLNLGDEEAAAELVAEALQASQDGFLLGVGALALQAAGAVNVRQGAVDEGIAQLETAVARFRAAGARPSEAMALHDLADARDAAGDHERAEATRAEALSVLESHRKAAEQRDP